MKSKSGFTIVELIIVISIIALLIGIAVVGYSKVQASTRDTTRKNNVAIITDGLEKYYGDNGEYPSVRDLVNNFAGNTGTVVAAKLGIDPAVLHMPKMAASATNAFTSTTPIANDFILYTASSVANNANCQTTAGGGCGQFTLQYIEEATGSTITVTSRHQGG